MNKFIWLFFIGSLAGCDPDPVVSIRDAEVIQDAEVYDDASLDASALDATLSVADASLTLDAFVRDAPSNSGLIWQYKGTFRWSMWTGTCNGSATRPADCVRSMLGQTILVAPQGELRPIGVFNEPVIQGSQVSFNFSQNHAEITGGIRCVSSSYHEVELEVWECSE